MSIDVVGDFLTVIRNGLMASKRTVSAPSSKLRVEIARVLKAEGYIKDYQVTEEDGKPSLTVFLKYVDGESVIHEVVRVSKPGRREYQASTALEPVLGGLGIYILTTNKGVVSDREAKKLAVGGEVLCRVW